MTKNINNQHPEIIELELYRSGELSDTEISVHIAECTHCQQEIFRLNQVANTLHIETASPQFSFDREHNMLSFIAKRSEEIKKASAKKPLKFINYFTRIAAMLAIIFAISLVYNEKIYNEKFSLENFTTKEPLQAKYDINNDQSVDIVDAFLFAKQTQKSEGEQFSAMINQIVAIER